MRKTILYLSGFMIISSLSVSCVFKKKFEELARAKREVDRNLLDLKRDKKQLEDQLQLAKDDFNTIRYKLTENNAVKDKNDRPTVYQITLFGKQTSGVEIRIE